MNENLKGMTREERLEYYRKEKEDKIKSIVEEFLEQVTIKEGQTLEEVINKRDWLLKDISVKHGYIPSSEIKQYLLEHYK